MPETAAREARIGPNAITRLAEALQAMPGPGAAEAVFAQAGLTRYLEVPPAAMVPERHVQALHRGLRERLPPAQAEAVAREAGRRTADYLLAHRIPGPFQAVLRRLPRAVAARLLLVAIGRHAWTFAGSGRFEVHRGAPIRFSITNNPLCRGERAGQPICSYFAATFEQLFRTLAHPHAQVVEVACEACGSPACVFELRWGSR